MILYKSNRDHDGVCISDTKYTMGAQLKELSRFIGELKFSYLIRGGGEWG